MAFELGTILRSAYALPNGLWNVAGYLHFYRADAHDQRKTVFEDRDGTIPYSNPITLDAIGSVPPIYYEDDEAYYIKLTDSSDPLGIFTPIWDVDDYWPTLSPESGTGSTAAGNTNSAINGQFRFFYKDSFTPLAAAELAIAPYWFFNKSNATATDSITFLPFLVGVDDPPFSPTYYCRYNCTNVPTGETSKDFYIKIQDVSAFQDQPITISIEQKGTVTSQLLEFRYLQNFGTGGTPSADVEDAISAETISTDWAKRSETTTLPSISGKTLGSNKDDYLAIILRMPLDAVTQVDFTNFQINLGSETLDYEFQTYDKAKIEERSVNYPIHLDFNGLDTEQNVADTTKLITIKEGVCTDSTGFDLFRSRAPLTKDITVTWAEGDLAGGLAEGLTIAADTYYNYFKIFSPNGKIDAGYDTSGTASNLLAGAAVQAAGYIFYRRVSSHKTNGSSLIKDYHQTYDTFLWDDPDNLINFTQPAATATSTFTLDVPPGFRVEASVNLTVSANHHVYATPTFVATLTPSQGANPLFTYIAGGTTEGGKYFILTDNAQQIKQTRHQTVGSCTYHVITLGWKDWRMD